MIRPIVKDPLFLARKSTAAGPEDIPAAIDLMDTLVAYSDRCVGMAANMIGVTKRIIIFYDESCGEDILMFNPVIVAKSGEYTAQEGCLSLPGERQAIRYKNITVEYQDMSFAKHKKNYSGFTAEIIQHEIDMTNGILI